MVLDPGEKLFIAHRRLFEGDAPRYFAGLVEKVSDGLVRLIGHSWSQDRYSGELRPKSAEVARIVSLGSGKVMAYVLPKSCDISEIEIRKTDKHCQLVDGDVVLLDLTEKTFRHA